MKAIVIYYSKSGNTEAAAKKIQADFSADILKVEPVKPYGGFISTCLRARKEKKKRIEVPVKTEIPDLSAYDMVFLGYPVWMSSIPSFFRDYMKKVNVDGKILIPFCSSKSTSIIPSIPEVKECCIGSGIKEGLAFRFSTDDAYRKWAELIKKTYN